MVSEISKFPHNRPNPTNPGLKKFNNRLEYFIIPVNPSVPQTPGDDEFNIIVFLIHYFFGIIPGGHAIIFIMTPENCSIDVPDGPAYRIPIGWFVPEPVDIVIKFFSYTFI